MRPEEFSQGCNREERDVQGLSQSALHVRRKDEWKRRKQSKGKGMKPTSFQNQVKRCDHYVKHC
jgi:hypothetical protein